MGIQNTEKRDDMLPIDFTERMKEMLGEEYKDFLSSYEKPRFQALRQNPLKIEQSGFLEKMPFSLKKVPWTTNGYYYEADAQPGRHPYHEAGLYYIQEPSAMAPVEYLEAKPGERILDLCAAPGGKTTQIGGFLKGEGLLVCNEIHPARAKILSENVERLGLRNILVTNETPQGLEAAFPGYFDKILVDAPCSGEGMFRKKRGGDRRVELKQCGAMRNQTGRDFRLCRQHASCRRTDGVLYLYLCSYRK